jgi:L-ascorbate metabolism protein UlaG (beta-lactamase superfamily)
VYLKPNVLVEPLFNQWYAWSHLIAPPTAALYIANQHLKVMQSFVAAPQIHISALKNPAMIGGPFINYDAARVPEIKALIEQTARECALMVELSKAIKRLDETLLNEANGYSLEPLYEKVPDLLKGYVELVYDLNNQPSIRFIEGLFYTSPFYDTSSQSISMSLVEGDDRPFVFSTPRLKSDGNLHLDVPFAGDALVELFKMKETPAPYGHIRELLGVGAEDASLFSTFFHEQAPPRRAPFEGDGVRVRYFGHACVLIETRETSVLVDPVISYHFDGATDRYTYADLPETIDYVLITHGHQDHCMFEPLLQLRHRIKHLVVPKNNGGALADPSLKLALRAIGFPQTVEIDEMEAIEIPGGRIVSLPFLGEHADINVRTKTAYFVRLLNNAIFMGADSNNIEPRLYEHIRRAVGDLDLLFLGMECDGAPMSWMYGPLMTKPVVRKIDQSRRFDGSDYRKGIEIVNVMNPKQVFVYAMGQEPWLTFLTSIVYTPESRPIVESDRLVEDCLRKGLRAERLLGHKEILLGQR